MRLFRKCIIINIRVFYKILYTSTLELLSAFKIKTNGCFLNNFYMYFNKLQNFLFISIRRVLYCCFAGIPIVLSRDIISIVPYTLRIYTSTHKTQKNAILFIIFVSSVLFYFVYIGNRYTYSKRKTTNRKAIQPVSIYYIIICKTTYCVAPVVIICTAVLRVPLYLIICCLL